MVTAWARRVLARPEWNWVQRIFMPATGPGAPVDLARTEFNSFLRSITCPLVFLITLMALGGAAEAIVTERARGTWDSLIATSLSARDILRSKMLASVWRLRWTAGTLLVLWTLGLAAGAIHPLGFIAAVLVTASSCWLYLNFALLASVKAVRSGEGDESEHWALLSGGRLVAFIYLLPAQDRIGVLGRGAPPFVAFLALASYRDVHIGLTDSAVPILQWININTGEGPLAIVSICVARDHRPGFRRALFLALHGCPFRSLGRQAVETGVGGEPAVPGPTHANASSLSCRPQSPAPDRAQWVATAMRAGRATRRSAGPSCRERLLIPGTAS